MKILNFGSLNLDKVYTVDHFVRPGETMSAEKMEIFCGGKGLNQSIALAKAGALVFHAGAVGEKDGGPLLEALAGAGVDITLVKKTDKATGHAVIQVDKSGQNSIILFGGANREITKEQADETFSHFEKGDILLLQNEINGLPYLIGKAKEKGMKVYLNPSPVTKELLDMPLDKIDCFILNEIEAGDICGEQADAEKLPDLMKEKFPGADVLLTLGEQGSVFYDGKRRFRQSAFSVKAVDTTGAGDTFTGYFIAEAAAGATIEKALFTAAKAAAAAVTKKGAAASIPFRAEVETAKF